MAAGDALPGPGAWNERAARAAIAHMLEGEWPDEPLQLQECPVDIPHGEEGAPLDITASQVTILRDYLSRTRGVVEYIPVGRPPCRCFPASGAIAASKLRKGARARAFAGTHYELDIKQCHLSVALQACPDLVHMNAMYASAQSFRDGIAALIQAAPQPLLVAKQLLRNILSGHPDPMHRAIERQGVENRPRVHPHLIEF